jgi:3-mercaptopyruvate sulfurtransferase SseA
MKISTFALSLLVIGLVACQTTPTRVKENLTMGPNDDASMTITKNTVVLDVRSMFDYVSSHLPMAYPVRWQDFSFNQENRIGSLKDDLTSVARYFARLGVSEQSHVVVVGNGHGGDGAEGRLAWMLQYLGVSHVSFVTENSIQMKRIAGEPGPTRNVAPWVPTLRRDLIATKEEITQVIAKKEEAVIIDVRTAQEYLSQTPNFRPPDIGAINIDWREFIDEKGKPQVSIVSKLGSVEITRDKKIIVISRRGVRSGLVTQVLRRLGFSRTANFAGGYLELLPATSQSKKKR